jgi:uncharacterized protein (TIGR04255 family)
VVAHEVFAKPPLKAMLGQVRFPTILRIADLTFLAKFQDAIRHEFPDFRQEQQITLVVGPQGPQAPSLQQAFRFTTADHAWSFLLTPDAVTVEADVSSGYASYEQFAVKFRLIWSSIQEHFAPDSILRQGLRYVDHLEADLAGGDWEPLINADLLGPLVKRFAATLTQAVSEVRLDRDDGVLVFKHGVLPLAPGTPAGYLLDFDYFMEQAGDASPDAIMSRFDAYHDFLYRFFRWCVTDTALEGFRVRN